MVISATYKFPHPFCWRTRPRRRICIAAKQRGLAMQDEHFIRDWAGLHHRASVATSHRGVAAPSQTSVSRKNRLPIGNAYAVRPDSDLKSGMSPVARASLRGFAASVLTFVLWVTVMVLATPTPGLASPLSEAAPCGAHPVLA